MSDPKTDPYDGELAADADLGPSEDAAAEPDDGVAENYADTTGMRTEGEAPLP